MAPESNDHFSDQIPPLPGKESTPKVEGVRRRIRTKIQEKYTPSFDRFSQQLHTAMKDLDTTMSLPDAEAEIFWQEVVDSCATIDIELLRKALTESRIRNCHAARFLCAMKLAELYIQADRRLSPKTLFQVYSCKMKAAIAALFRKDFSCALRLVEDIQKNCLDPEIHAAAVKLSDIILLREIPPEILSGKDSDETTKNKTAQTRRRDT